MVEMSNADTLPSSGLTLCMSTKRLVVNPSPAGKPSPSRIAASSHKVVDVADCRRLDDDGLDAHRGETLGKRQGGTLAGAALVVVGRYPDRLDAAQPGESLDSAGVQNRPQQHAFQVGQAADAQD